MLSTWAIGKGVRRVSVDEMFDDIYKAKVEHSQYASSYREEQARVIENLIPRKYGKRITYRYEPLDVSPTVFAPRMLLAYFVAERALLFHARDLRKNLVISIVGMGGSGKTTYMVMSFLGSLLLLLRVAGAPFRPSELKDYLIGRVFFEPYTMVSTIRRLIEEKKWSPFLGVDDVGTQINKYWIFLGQHYWVYLFSTLDQVKDWCGVLVLTAKSLNSIPARLREITDIVVEAREVVTSSGFVADVFEYYRYEDYTSSHSRKARLKKIVFVDVMPPTVRIPDDIWNKMMEIRRSTGLRRMKLIEKSISALPELEAIQLTRMLKRLNAPAPPMEEVEEEAEEEV